MLVFVSVLCVALAIVSLQAKSVTNLGKTFTVNTLNDDGPLGSDTVTQDISKIPTQSDRQGLYVIHYDFANDGGATVDLGSADIAKRFYRNAAYSNISP